MSEWDDFSRSPREIFRESLERCAEAEDFLPSFYRRFLSSSEEVRWKFRHTDFTVQNDMLLRSLRMAAGAAEGDREALQEMRERAESHNRHHLDIQPDLYKLWLYSVIITARRFDPKWDPEIEMAWYSVLGHIIDHMIRHY
ncbi:MAG: hypothetical protein RL885_28435 [Planctomycetota bacterium]